MFEYRPYGARVLLRLKMRSKNLILPENKRPEHIFDENAEIVDLGKDAPKDLKVGTKVLLTPNALIGVPIFDRKPDFYCILNAAQIFATKKEEQDGNTEESETTG